MNFYSLRQHFQERGSMRGNKNLEIYIKLFTVLALALFLAYELISGKITYYVHPRYLYGIWGAVVALLVFACSMMGELRRGRHNSNLKPYLLYLLPVVLAILFPAVEGGNGNIAIAQSSKGAESLYGKIAADTADGKTEDSAWNTDGASADGDMQDSNGDSAADVQDSDGGAADIRDSNGDSAADVQDSEEITGDSTDDSSGDAANEEEKDRSLKYKNKTGDGAILISDEEFGCWYFELFDFLKDFKGKRYQYTAQVFRMEDLKANQFLAGRYVMTCCALDLMGYGIITENDKSSSLKENEWITVTGTIGEYEYKGSKVPCLKDVVIKKTKAPKDEYVYYYYY